MGKAQIEWVKNPDGSQGFTWNPITGYFNECEYCYARKLANGRLKSRYLAGGELAPLSQDGLYPVSDRDLRLSGGKPKGIFVCDISDLFGIGIPYKWTNRVLTEMRIYKLHRFYLLTKQPQNLIKFSPYPDNYWVGVSATDKFQTTLAQHYLYGIEAKIKYISFEPLLEDITKARLYFKGTGNRIDWIIIGAQTCKSYWELCVINSNRKMRGLPELKIMKHGKIWTLQPEIEWVQEIALDCTKAHIPLFLKDNLRPLLPYRMPFYNVISYWSQDKTHKLYETRLRQEMPKGE